MRLSSTLTKLVAVVAVAASIYAQQITAVPRLIRFNGSHYSASQQTQTGVLGATFSIYRELNDGAPLWSEIQNVQPDEDGNYSILLGSTRPDGVPLDLFTAAEPRWLEVEINQVKQPRILLGSVPYALKSVDADTLGGLPPSAYLRVNQSTNSTTNNATTVVVASLSPLANIGVPGCIGVFSDTTDLICSTINQSTYLGNPAVSIGGTAVLGAMTLIGNVPFSDAAGMALYNEGAGAGASVSLDMYNTPYNGGIPQAKIKAIDDGSYSDNLTFWTKIPGAPANPVTEKMRITSTGSVGIGTTAPSQRLEVAGTAKFDSGVMFGDGTTQTTAAVSGGGTGSITAVVPGTGLTGGGTSGAVTLSLDTTKVPQLNASNTFVGNQNVTGNLSVTGQLILGGSETPLTLTSSQYNFGEGYEALQALTSVGEYNTAVGPLALQLSAFGSQNTAVGYAALSNDTSGGGNVAVGVQAMGFNTTGFGNTAVGIQALVNNTSASYNTAVGNNALGGNTTGTGNVAMGEGALQGNTTGSGNTSLGYEALFLGGGQNNTAVGYCAFNCAIPETSARGSNGIALGYNAGSNAWSGSNNIDIGSAGTTSDSGVIRVGDVQTQTFIAGISGVNVSGVPVLVSSSGQLGIASSSRRFKEDIQDMGNATADLMRLRPVTFRYKKPFEDGSKPIQYGLVAEEVAEVYPDLVAHSADGRIETVKYQVLDSMLLNELQKQNATITAQKEKIQSLEERLARLESLLERTSSAAGSRQ